MACFYKKKNYHSTQQIKIICLNLHLVKLTGTALRIKFISSACSTKKHQNIHTIKDTAVSARQSKMVVAGRTFFRHRKDVQDAPTLPFPQIASASAIHNLFSLHSLKILNVMRSLLVSANRSIFYSTAAGGDHWWGPLR